MNKLTLAFLIAAFLLVLPVQATIYVGGDEGVTSISEAIALAKENETIIVYEGIYHENVVIDKPLVLKTSGNVTIEARDDSASVVWIKAHNVVFSSFHVKRGYNGISLNNVQSGKIENNSVFENDFGIALISSCNNIIANNTAFNNKVNGIHLQDYSDTNKITNNTACENSDVGLQIQDSEENIVTHNSLSMNLDGIGLLRANKNELRNNNVVDSKNNQARVQDSALNKFNYNYWSDYEAQYPDAQEKSNTGIGDIPYEIKGYEQVDYDDYPYMNYSGWLNVVITPEYWEFYTKKGDIQYFYNNFSIENRLNSPTEVEILLEQNLEFVTDSERASTKTFSIEPKSTENITLRLNVTDLEGYILRTITFKTEDYIKTTLVHGLVQPKINDVKIEGVDFHRNVVKGQINQFNVMLRNHGDRDEFNVTLTMGSKKQSKRVFLSDNKSETKTVPFEIDTSDMPLGITRGQVVVLKSNQLSDPQLDYLNLTLYVASELEASTLIVTNHKRMRENWGNDSSVNASKLKDKVLAVCFHPAVNGIILDVASNTNISILFDEWDNAKRSEKANEIAKAIKRLIETKCKLYQNIEYLVIVGDDRIIPYYRITDNTSEPFIAGWDTERNYHELNVNSTVGSALYDNMFLTDNIYAAGRPIEWETAEVNIPELYIPIMPVSRLVESPDNISAVIDAFFKEEYVNPDKIFVCGSDFMKDSASLCGSVLEKKTEGVVTVVMDETANSSREVKDEFLNVSNNILFLFQHAHHDRFNIYMGTITSHDIAQPSVTLINSFVCSMGCHSGLNVPPNSSADVPDLVEAFAQKGVTAYIAPTGYSIGLRRTIGAHELLYSYLNKYLCEGRDVGTALMQAKQEYWATNYDFDHIDEKVLESTTLYGLPWVRIRLPRLRAVGDESEVQILSFDERVSNEQPDTLVIRPLHRQNSTQDGNYYMTQSRELLSDPGKPVQPKEIRVFYPTAERVLRGAVLNSSKYVQNKSFTPLIDAYM
jgi:parallel beta-helix repeat protein